MKIYKISLIAAVVAGLLLACAGTVSAQDAAPGGKKKGANMTPQARMEQMDKVVTLTDAQKPKVTALFEEQGKKMGEIRDLPQDQRREKMTAMREESDTKLKAILTPAQFEKWQKERPQYGKKGQGKQGDAAKKE